MTANQINSELKQRVQGLWLPSETEAPWTVPSWTLQTDNTADLLQVLRRDPETSVTETSLDELMAQIQRQCRGYGAEGNGIAQRHQALFEFLQQIGDRWRVFRVGEVTVDIVVVGETAAGYVALQTQSVET
ncbi:MAG: nuclease A inhibitor family protein [Cyanobacteria bacterium P01_C01_bin.120]